MDSNIFIATILAFLFFIRTARSLEPTECSKHGSECDNQGGEEPKQKVQYKGHFEPFGESGSKTPVQEITGYPDANNFFLDHVLPSVPVLMKGAATLSPAFHKWTDDYLLRLTGLEENRNVKIDVESGKKEIRGGKGWSMTFHHFLQVYNDSDLYLVTDVLPFMEPFLVKPCPLQCPELNQVPMKHLIWFSSGGTKSVVHIDDLDNINCIYRGNKTFVMLDPSGISTGTIIDAILGTYSKLDVDSVDLNLYPTLRGASFITATMEPGDCLYIPYRWIHQVRSFGSNMAVNDWFHHRETTNVLRKGYCTGLDIPCDPTFTLGRVKHPDEDAVVDDDGITLLRLYFEQASIHGDACVTPDKPPMTKAEEKVKTEEFVSGLVETGLDHLAIFGEKSGDWPRVDQREKIVNEFRDLIRGLDVNSDGILTSSEFEDGIGDVWDDVLEMRQWSSGESGGTHQKYDNNRNIKSDDVLASPNFDIR